MKATDRIPTSNALSKKEILSLLEAKTKASSEVLAVATKYPVLKKILGTAVAALPPDTQMPGIRDLARSMGTSLVTAQRAVRELTNDGVLYSKSRSGVFVGKGPEPEAPSALPRRPFRATFDFGTDSAAPYQRHFWEELAGIFCKRYPNSAVNLHYETEPFQRDKPLDVYEGYDWNKRVEGIGEDILDIATFAGSLLPTVPVREGWLPLYYRTHYLFFNRALLEQHGLPAPDFKTFDEQFAYFQNLAPQLQKAGLDPRPFSFQEPVTLFGGQLAAFANLFDEGDSKLRESLVRDTERLINFCKLCRYYVKESNTDLAAGRNEFLQGRAPFFMGYSVDYWEFSQENRRPFQAEAYPMLCCDDSYFLLPRFGVISRASEHPVESMNFLIFLLRPEVQKRFAETGNIGVNRAESLFPQMAADPAWVARVLKKSTPFQVLTKEQHYATVNILGGELWRALLEKATAEQILERAIHIRRSYMQYCLDREARTPGPNAPLAP